MGFFAYAQSQIESLMDGIVETAQSNFAQSLSEITTGAVTLYIFVYGYMVLFGKVNSPVRELLWKGASFIIILAFVNNSGGLLTLAGGAVQELSTIGSGGSAVGMDFLDELMDKSFDLAIELYDQGDMVSGSLAFILVTLSFGFLFVTIFFTISAPFIYFAQNYYKNLYFVKFCAIHQLLIFEIFSPLILHCF